MNLPLFFDVDITQPLLPVPLPQMLVSKDSLANRIGVRLYQGKTPYSPGGQCAGYVVRRDGYTVPITGVINGNEMYIDLSAAAYALEGPINIGIKNVQGSAISTVFLGMGTVSLGETDIVIDPGSTITLSVAALVAEIEETRASIPMDYSALSAAVAVLQQQPTDTVLYGTTQTLTDAQKAQARGNISAANTQDVADAKTATTILDSKTNELFGYVNFGYDNPEELPINSSSAAQKIGIKRVLTTVLLNGTTGTSFCRLKISNNLERGATNDQVRAFTNPLDLISGHTYRLTLAKISGTFTHESYQSPVLAVYESGGTANIASGQREADGRYVATFTADGSTYHIIVVVPDNATIVNGLYSVIMQDTATESVFDAINDLDEKSNDLADDVTALQDLPTDTVLYGSAQTLTDAQKAQARGNISAANTQDVADAKTATTILDSKTNELFGYVNYGYDNPEELPINSSSAAQRIGIKRVLTTVLLNGTTGTSSCKIKISNNLERGATNDQVRAFTNPLDLISGHTYRLTLAKISGTFTHESYQSPVLAVYESGGTANIASGQREADGRYVTTFTADGSTYHIIVVVPESATIVNGLYSVVMEDTATETIFDEVKNAEASINHLMKSYFALSSADAVAITATEESPKDLNDYTTPGNYKVTTVSNARNIAHIPYVYGGRLTVIPLQSSTAVVQIYAMVAETKTNIAVRNLYNGVWTDWKYINPTYDDAPTENSSRPVTSGGVYSAIEAVKIDSLPFYTAPLGTAPTFRIPLLAPAGQAYINDVAETDGESANITQGICSDGRRYLYYNLAPMGENLGHEVQQRFRKWDTWTNSSAGLSEPGDWGHCEDTCFVPAWCPGFDNGNVDRLYTTDFDYSIGHSTGRYIHVIDANTLEEITSFPTNTIRPDVWNGANHVTFNQERGLFCLRGGKVLEDDSKLSVLFIFDKNGTLLRGAKTKVVGTTFGIDSDENYIYLTRYVSSDGTTTVYGYAVDWNLNPVARFVIDKADWEAEGICHIGGDFYVSWNQAYSSNRKNTIEKTTLIYEYHALTDAPPFNWPTSDGLRINNWESIEI